jgi:hypothetical protein
MSIKLGFMPQEKPVSVCFERKLLRKIFGSKRDEAVG